MPTVWKFAASRLVIYAGDHPPAHVHVQLRDGRESILSLREMRLTGRIQAREIREELDWIAANKSWLYAHWRKLNP
jgi:hypothetical protein